MKRDDAIRRIREAKAIFGEQLLLHPDIHGIGIGYKRKGKTKTRTLALVVHVYKKRPLKEIEESRRIPATFRFYSKQEKTEVSVPCDVREVLPPAPEVKCGKCSTDFEKRVRPVPGGFSVGLVGVAGGTLGGYMWDKRTDQIVFLSNEHVLGSVGGATVVQPSAFDGGSSPADDFGSVIRSGSLDITISKTDKSSDRKLEIECSGPAVYEIGNAALEMKVEKVGQTTGLTCGLVELIDYDSGHYGSHNDLWIDGDGNDFSAGGDSGSLYMEMNPPAGQTWKRAVGIHWGGSGNDGVGHPLPAVFKDLDLTTLCAGVVNALIEAVFRGGNDQDREREEEQAECYPGPFVQAGQPVPFYHGVARDFESRIESSKTGAQVLSAIRAHREDVVNLLLTGDGWRASVAALAPILCGKVTTDEILAHRLTATDIENFRRVMEISKRIRPKSKPLLALGQKLLVKAKGRTLSSIFIGRAR